MTSSHRMDVTERLKDLAFKKFEFETALQETADAVRAWEDVQKVLKLTSQVRAVIEKSDIDLQQRCVCLPPLDPLAYTKTAGVPTMTQKAATNPKPKTQKTQKNLKTSKSNKNSDRFVYMPNVPKGVKISDINGALSSYGAIKTIHFYPAQKGAITNGYVEFELPSAALEVVDKSFVIKGTLVDFEPVNGRLQM